MTRSKTFLILILLCLQSNVGSSATWTFSRNPRTTDDFLVINDSEYKFKENGFTCAVTKTVKFGVKTLTEIRTIACKKGGLEIKDTVMCNKGPHKSDDGGFQISDKKSNMNIILICEV